MPSNQPPTPAAKAAANHHLRTPQPPLHHLPPPRSRSHRRGIRPLARPLELSQDYKLNDYRTVYRHARAAGLLLQRRERLHSALDAFVESVDDVTFTGDTILRAMRAYSCIDSHGRWTEIPTHVQFSTSTDPHPPQPSPRGTHVGSDVIDIDSDEESENDTEENAEEDEENAPEERVTALDVLNVFRKYGVQASRNDATAAEDEYDEPEDDDSDADADSDDDDESEEDAENEFEELVTASDVLNVVRKYANQASRSDATDAADESEEDAENELEKLVTSRLTSSKSPSPSDTDCLSQTPSKIRRRAATLPLALTHPRKPCRETLFAARIRMTGRFLTAPIAPRHLCNRLFLQNRSRTPTAASGTHARAIRIRRSRSQTLKAASCTKST